MLEAVLIATALAVVISFSPPPGLKGCPAGTMSGCVASMMSAFLDGVPARLGPDAKYGLGVIIRPSAAGLTYGHSGFMPGYQTELVYFPEMRVSIAVQVNSSAPRSTGKALRAFAIDFANIIKSSTFPAVSPK